jgi:N-dimethylarginine dimethylaminohydrolase
MKKILMCPPNYFDVEYEINPWMNKDNKVNRVAVLNTYSAVKSVYDAVGFPVYEIEQEKGLPDMVYTANIGYAEGNVFLRSNFKHPERRKEPKLAADFLKQNGFEIHTVPEEIFFEGEGDVIRSDKKYFMGHGKRTDPRAKKYLEETFKKEFIDLELIDPYYYHLDTCFAPLNDDVVVINRKSFTPEALGKIEKSFNKIIDTNDQDNKVLACNLVVAGNVVVLGKGISPELSENIKKEGFEVREIDMSEYMKGGESVKCITFEIFDPE